MYKINLLNLEGLENEFDESNDSSFSENEILELEELIAISNKEMRRATIQNFRHRCMQILFIFTLISGIAHRENIANSIDKLRYIPGPSVQIHNFRYWLKSLFRKGEKTKYLQKIEKNNGTVDDVDFFAHKDYFEGKIDKEDIQLCIDKFRERIKKYRQLSKKRKVEENIHEMINTQGRYVPYKNGVCHSVLENKSQCSARAKHMYLMIKGVYGNKIPMKWVKTFVHLEIAFKLNGVWHLSQKPGLNPMKKEDFEGTTTIEPSGPIKAFTGKKVKEVFTQKGGKKITKEKKYSKGSTFAEDGIIEGLKHNIVPGNFGAVGYDSPESKVDQKTSFKIAEARRQKKLEKDRTNALKKGERPLKIKLLSNKEFQAAYNKAVGNKITPADIRKARATGMLDLSNRPIEDLSPLKGIVIYNINLTGTKVKSLEALRDMPILYLYINKTEIKDLSPLKGVRLHGIAVNKYIKNLSDFPSLRLYAGENNIQSVPNGEMINLKTLQIVKIKGNEHKKELLKIHQKYNIKAIQANQKIKPIQEGEAKKGTNRECLRYDIATRPNETICLGEDKFVNSARQGLVDSIILEKLNNGIWQIRFAINSVIQRPGKGITPLGEVEWYRNSKVKITIAKKAKPKIINYQTKNGVKYIISQKTIISTAGGDIKRYDSKVLINKICKAKTLDPKICQIWRNKFKIHNKKRSSKYQKCIRKFVKVKKLVSGKFNPKKICADLKDIKD